MLAMRYQFNTAAQAKQFMRALRKNGILSELVTKREVQIHAFELINELMKPLVLARANRAYNRILNEYEDTHKN